MRRFGSRGSARRNLTPASVTEAQILDVNPDAWTMTLRTVANDEIFTHVPIVSTYLHHFAGEGIHYMPEAGTMCWICKPSEGDTKPFIVAFRPPADEKGTFRANRPVLNPGDVHISTRDGNAIKIRRGGVIEIEASPLARTFWLPVANKIMSFAANHEIVTLGGSQKWRTARPEEDEDGNHATKYTLKAKEFSEHKQQVVQLDAGGQIDGGVFKLQVFADGNIGSEDALDAQFSATIDKEGKVAIEADDVDIHLHEGKTVRIFDSDGSATEGVVLGKTFLTDLLTFFTGLQTILGTIGLTVPGLSDMITKTTTTLGVEGAPYLSTRTKTE